MGSGNIACVPLLTSRGGNEGHIFSLLNVTTADDYETQVHSLFNGQLNFFGQLDLIYPPASPPGVYAYDNSRQRADWVVGDAFIAC
ncbi:uncharacterized protein A1O5_00602, partial [Cladophialophora psammophila CBS 110553]